MTNPTLTNYQSFSAAYDWFNRRLFADALPRCLITMQRGKRYYGFFVGGNWTASQDKGKRRRTATAKADEIALNPSLFRSRSTEDTLSTFAHEMVHLWQFHHGTSSRTGYHNKEWAKQMRAIGLIPSDTGELGGKETGQHMSHYIEPVGKFQRVCAALIQQGFAVPYHDFLIDEEAQKAKVASKTKYTCPECALNAWAKPGVRLMCEDCDQALVAGAAA